MSIYYYIVNLQETETLGRFISSTVYNYCTTPNFRGTIYVIRLLIAKILLAKLKNCEMVGVATCCAAQVAQWAASEVRTCAHRVCRLLHVLENNGHEIVS